MSKAKGVMLLPVTDCLHCMLTVVLKAYLELNPPPESSREEILGSLMQLATEFIVGASKDNLEIEQAKNILLDEIPRGIRAAMLVEKPEGKLS